MLLLAAVCRAQVATPEGNAHPRSDRVSAASGQLSNPFGEPDWRSDTTAARKQDFARAVRFSDAFRAIPVFHGNRVKALDTLARETAADLTGRHQYAEGKADGSGTFRYDPMFTMLDVMIDPGSYRDRPLLSVSYLPLRTAYVDAAVGASDGPERDRLMKLARVSPMTIDQHTSAVLARLQQGGGAPGRAVDERLDRALREVDGEYRLFQVAWQNLLLIAPAQPTQPYVHVAALPPDSPVRHALAELASAWRQADATAVNASLDSLEAGLESLNAGRGADRSRVSLELLYNQTRPFEWGLWTYLASLVALVLAFGTQRRWLVGVGLAALLLAVGFHAFGFVARCLIAERFAIQNQFESMTGLSLFASLVAVGLLILRRQPLFGAAAAGVGFLVLITATQTAVPGREIEREAAILNTSVLLKYHVTTVLVSYGLISLGFIVSLFYLATHYAARLRRRSDSPSPRERVGGRVPAATPVASSSSDAPAITAQAALGGGRPAAGVARTLADLDTAQMTILQLAFWALGVGVLLGAWWADHSWGRWWGWDPKETWALVTWIIYLAVIHLRFVSGVNRGVVTAWLSVLGFLMMLWTYFGVNLLLAGLHSYA